MIAWIIGWDLILEFALGASVVARGWSGYLGDLLRPADVVLRREVGRSTSARCSSCWCSASSRSVGIRESARVTNTLVLIKVVDLRVRHRRRPVLHQGREPHPVRAAGAARDRRHVGPDAAAVAGALRASRRPRSASAGILTAAAVVFFAYTGFEAVANLSEETRDPARDMPLGMLGTLGAVDRALHRRLVRHGRHDQATTGSTRGRRSPRPSGPSARTGRRRWSPSPRSPA